MPPASDAPPETRDPPTESLAPQSIVWIDGRSIHRPMPGLHQIIQIILYCAIVIFVIFCFNYVGANSSSAPAAPAWSYLIPLPIIIGVTLFFLTRQRIKWVEASIMAKAFIRSRVSSDPAQLIQAALETNGGPAGYANSGTAQSVGASRFQDHLARWGLPRALTIVDHAVESEIASIDIPEHQVGARPIVRMPARLTWSVAFMIGGILYGGVYFVPKALNGNILHMSMAALCVYCIVMLVLPYFGVRVGQRRAPVAGPGYVDDRKKKRRWRATDSLFIVTRDPRVKSLLVELAGPPGYLALHFERPDDGGFIALWQRWRHPHPRLELADEL